MSPVTPRRFNQLLIVLIIAFLLCLWLAVPVMAQVTAQVQPDPTLGLTQQLVGTLVTDACANNGAQLNKWLLWALVPLVAQLLRNLRKWYPAIDSSKLLAWAAFHFLDAPASVAVSPQPAPVAPQNKG